MASAPKRSTLSADYQRDWPEYFDAVKDQPPRDTLLRALAAFEREGAPPAEEPLPQPLPGRKGNRRTAIDLACGEGRDTREILRRAATAREADRWRVIAIDSHPEGVSRTVASLGTEARSCCDVRQLTMEAVPSDAELTTLTTHGVDLINASFALPFCNPDHFPTLWNWIHATLRPGARFAGQFFGDRDEWQCVRPKSHVTRAQLHELLKPYTIEHLDEVEKDGSDAMGGVKHHHVFHVVARRA